MEYTSQIILILNLVVTFGHGHFGALLHAVLKMCIMFMGHHLLSMIM